MTAAVTRRSALTAAAVAAVGGVAGYVFARNSDAAKSTSGGDTYGGASAAPGRSLATVADIPEGGGVIGDGVVVCRPSGDTVHAFSAKCTHFGCTVSRVSHNKIFCPCHGSVFNARDGSVVQGPASTALPAVQVAVRDGEVFSA